MSLWLTNPRIGWLLIYLLTSIWSILQFIVVNGNWRRTVRHCLRSKVRCNIVLANLEVTWKAAHQCWWILLKLWKRHFLICACERHHISITLSLVLLSIVLLNRIISWSASHIIGCWNHLLLRTATESVIILLANQNRCLVLRCDMSLTWNRSLEAGTYSSWLNGRKTCSWMLLWYLVRLICNATCGNHWHFLF